MEQRPKICPEPTQTDIWIEILGILALLAMIGYPAYHYNELASEIPQHFGLDGQPDRYGSKTMVWLLPGLGILLYGGMWYLNKFPYIFNYTRTITQENAERQYRLARRMMRSLNTFIAITFAYISYSIVKGGLEEELSLGWWFIPSMLVGMTAILIVYLVHANRD